LGFSNCQCPLAGVDFVPTFFGESPTLSLFQIYLPCNSNVSAIENRQLPGAGFIQDPVTGGIYNDYNGSPTTLISLTESLAGYTLEAGAIARFRFLPPLQLQAGYYWVGWKSADSGITLPYCDGCPEIANMKQAIFSTIYNDLPADVSNAQPEILTNWLGTPVWLNTTIPPPPPPAGTTCMTDGDCMSSGGNQWLYATCGSDGHCQCGNGFSGTATTTNPCGCTGNVVYDNGIPICVPIGKCIAGSTVRADLCYPLSTNSMYVTCTASGVCQCNPGFQGSATPTDLCRCNNPVVWEPVCPA